MNLSKIPELFQNQPTYRLKQAKRLIYLDLISDWNEAKTLPQELREKLSVECPLEIKARFTDSQDKKSQKALITFQDGMQVEAVLMRHSDGRNTVCVSCMVGCPLNCSFCATGKAGFKRNLSTEEIVSQVLFFARQLKKEKTRITNVVFMGMGEPFLNYDAVLNAIKYLHDPEGFNLGARHFSISTAGISEAIKKLSEENLEINLAISLHAPNDKIRNQLMPVNEKYPLQEVLAAVKNYVRKTRRRVMFEYVLIDGINDSETEARELVGLLHGILGMVNLIPYNPTGVFHPSSANKISAFRKIIEENGIAVTQRYRFGDKISAACGQLVSGK